MQSLAEVRLELLAWAGLHRGTSISEEAMPRFHEIIDAIDALIAKEDQQGGGELTQLVAALARARGEGDVRVVKRG